jgi:DNA-directed RNA polymerase subunit RPC12/RpoP
MFSSFPLSGSAEYGRGVSSPKAYWQNSMEYKTRFVCLSCREVWESSDFSAEENGDAKRGLNCPECNSVDIAGEDI